MDEQDSRLVQLAREDPGYDPFELARLQSRRELLEKGVAELQEEIVKMLPSVIRSTISFANANLSVQLSKKRSFSFSVSEITYGARRGFNAGIVEKDVQVALDEMVRAGVLERRRCLKSLYLTRNYYKLVPGQELFISVVNGVVHYSYE